MIRVIIELVPFGVEEKKKTLSQIEIINTGAEEDTFDLYNYSYHGYLEETPFSGKVKHFRSSNVLTLLSVVLKKILL